MNKWLNCGIRIPYQYAVAIEIATYGKVTSKELAPHIKFQRKGKAVFVKINVHEMN